MREKRKYVERCAGLPGLAWAVFLALTCLHILANVRAMRALRVKTINTARLEVLLSHALPPEVVEASLPFPPYPSLIKQPPGFSDVPNQTV